MVVELFPVFKVPFALHASILSSYRMRFKDVLFKSFPVFRFKCAYITLHLFLFISFRIIRLGGVAKRVICFIFLSIILMIFLIIFVIFLIIFVSILIIITNIIFINIILICSLSIVFILFFISIHDMLVHTVFSLTSFHVSTGSRNVMQKNTLLIIWTLLIIIIIVAKQLNIVVCNFVMYVFNTFILKTFFTFFSCILLMNLLVCI